ncbi:MAG: hypothetical protein GY796_22375 [Chloroflexi bacterium]|nr:hypothetical protein [Chloroflexota bacterium]
MIGDLDGFFVGLVGEAVPSAVYEVIAYFYDREAEINEELSISGGNSHSIA